MIEPNCPQCGAADSLSSKRVPDSDVVVLFCYECDYEDAI